MDQEVEQILEQIEADHNFLLSGGAGSGKTYTLVQVIREVLSSYHTNIACITYTNAAAQEIERRVNDKNLYVSTIHDFLWDNIKNYQNELKKAVIHQLNDPGSKMSIAGMNHVDDNYFDNRVEPVNIQYKEYLLLKEGIISHDEVIEVANYMFAHSKKLCHILKSRYPFIFIDEYQDTDPKVIELLLTYLNCSEQKCILGFFGDSMQAIYDNTIGVLDGYKHSDANPEGSVYEVIKTQNRRCPQTVIDIANKVRTDGLQQRPSTDPKAPNMSDGQAIQGSAKFYYTDNTDGAQTVKQALVDAGWNFDDTTNTKELRLTHTLIASEAGFETLYDIYNSDKIVGYRSKVKKFIEENIDNYDFSSVTFGGALDDLQAQYAGNSILKPTPAQQTFIDEHPALFDYARTLNFEAFNKCHPDTDQIIDDIDNDESNSTSGTTLCELTLHLDKIEECIRHYLAGEYNEFMRCTSVGHIKKASQKKKLKDAIIQITSPDEMTIQQVIDIADRLNICKKSDKLEKYITNNDYVYHRVKDVKYEEFRHLYDYRSNILPFSTQHKTKGLEYQNVFVVLDNGRWSKYNFASLFDQGSRIKESVKERTRKLFYVCCTRAKEKLAVYYPAPSAVVIAGAQAMFGVDNVIKI